MKLLSKLTYSPPHWALGLYICFIMGVLPLMSILRVLRVSEPGELRNLLLPVLLFLLVFAFGFSKILRPKIYLQYILILVFLQSAIVGGAVNEMDSFRSYFSHLFQLGSAYLLIGIGWQSVNKFGYKFWYRSAVLSLVSVFISSVMILITLSQNNVGRLYTPVFGLIFVMSFSLIYSRNISWLSYIILLISNKRGPIISIVVVHLFSIFSGIWQTRSTKYFAKVLLKTLTVSVVILVGLWISIKWVEDNKQQEDSAIIKAMSITYGRFERLIVGRTQGMSLDAISAGRVDEVEVALKSVKWLAWGIGSGAGWSIVISDQGKIVHNIHTSPLSISIVYGLPFTLFLYGFIVKLLLESISRSVSVERFSVVEKMAPYYLLGALVHSLVAYSLFIDFFFFFFVGVLSHTLKAARNGVYHEL